MQFNLVFYIWYSFFWCPFELISIAMFSKTKWSFLDLSVNLKSFELFFIRLSCLHQFLNLPTIIFLMAIFDVDQEFPQIFNALLCSKNRFGCGDLRFLCFWSISTVHLSDDEHSSSKCFGFCVKLHLRIKSEGAVLSTRHVWSPGADFHQMILANPYITYGDRNRALHNNIENHQTLMQLKGRNEKPTSQVSQDERKTSLEVYFRTSNTGLWCISTRHLNCRGRSIESWRHIPSCGNT
jgi:hypothetical protein